LSKFIKKYSFIDNALSYKQQSINHIKILIFLYDGDDDDIIIQATKYQSHQNFA